MRFAIPVVVLVGLLVLLAVGLGLKPSEVPSPLIGKPVPAFSLMTLDGSQTVTEADLKGRPLLVNFWATWCAPCRIEHPLLMQLANEAGVEIVGIDYKDTREAAETWLARHGNPYRSIMVDPLGSASIDWGVYGVPETYVLDASGVILYKQIGPMTGEVWEQRIKPLLQVRS